MDRVTLITGGNKGLGYEAAKELKAKGYKVYIGSRNEERGQKASNELGVDYVQLDVSDDESVQQAFKTLSEKKDVSMYLLIMLEFQADLPK